MIKAALRNRTLRRAEGDETSLGNILVQLGYVDDRQIQDALRDQGSGKLGEFLVKCKLCTADQIAHAVLRQKQARGTASAVDVERLHRRDRRRLMQGVLDGLRDVSELSRQLTSKYGKPV